MEGTSDGEATNGRKRTGEKEERGLERGKGNCDKN